MIGASYGTLVVANCFDRTGVQVDAKEWVRAIQDGMEKNYNAGRGGVMRWLLLFLEERTFQLELWLKTHGYVFVCIGDIVAVITDALFDMANWIEPVTSVEKEDNST